ncbi:hypothetical protein TcasGA2_TC006772 [Tribolium castaneum]|uniref:Uncharacterized protein n=1 Tax=Tribolium castaneum TaxID=7070 RepID=D6WUS0_TRICA|nr:hypothetical protein TcasGA2_TC006772 [Tribolium castaneum]
MNFHLFQCTKRPAFHDAFHRLVKTARDRRLEETNFDKFPNGFHR